MDEKEINGLVFNALSNLYSIETSKVSMYPLDDKYGHSPFLRFRFKFLSKNDSIYRTIGNSISGSKAI
ncbi:MAG: hypothetical protein IPN86_15935 [Saprospiraceae bacterium]|nr:hypothetical protein [Saprospiraceae bacterium]